MILQRATGVVLRTRPLTDTSLIVHWLTREFGRIATVARGARRAKSPFRGQIDLFYLAELSFARSNRTDLHALREVRLLDAHAALRANLSYLQQTAHCVALIEQTTEAEAPLPVIFDNFLAMLVQLPSHPPRLQTIFAFQIKLLRDLGLEPPLSESSLTPGSRRLSHQCLTLDWSDLQRLRLSPAQETEIRSYLHGFIIYHFGKIPRWPKT